MKVDITWPNGEPRSIESVNPGLVGLWVIEQFSRYLLEYPAGPGNPPQAISVRVFPSQVLGEDGIRVSLDWVPDARVISTYAMIRTPQEFLDMLARQIADYARLSQADITREEAPNAAV